MKRLFFFLALMGLGFGYSFSGITPLNDCENITFAELEEDSGTIDLALARQILSVAAIKFRTTPEALTRSYLLGECTIEEHETLPQAYRVRKRDNGVLVLLSEL